MERRTRTLGALLALAALAVLGPLAAYGWTATEDGQLLPELGTPSPETQEAPPPASSPVEPAEPTPAAEGVEEAGSGEPGPLSEVQERAINEGPLVPDPAAYERLKEQANQKAAQQQYPDQGTPSPETQEAPPPAPLPAELPPAAERAGELRVEEAGPGEPGPLSEVQERAINEGPLVPDPAAYERLKQQANEKAGQS